MAERLQDRSVPAALKATIPVLSGYLVLGIGFGLLCVRAAASPGGPVSS